MKRLLPLLIATAALASQTDSFAQSTMLVTKTDGTEISIRVTEIHDITFPDDGSLNVSFNYGTYWLHPEQWVQLEATCSTTDGEEAVTNIQWSSTDEAVVSIDKYGRATGIGEGKCQIIATADDSHGSITINVVNEPMLDISIGSLGNRDCSYTITPADESLRYYHDYRIQSGDYSVDGLDQYGSEEQNILHFVKDWWSFCGEMYGMTELDFMNEYGLSSGTAHETLSELKSGSQYCIFALAMSEDGNLASPVEVKKFTTTVPEESDITFQIIMDEVTSKSATFTIIPSNDDPYFVNVQRASYVDWFVENDQMDDMVQSLTSSISPKVYPEAYCSGTVTRSTSDFLSSVRSNTDYYVIVFGFDDGATSPVTLHKFHTQ